MKNNDDFVFWDDMWNQSGDTSENKVNIDEDHVQDMLLNKLVDELLNEEGDDFLMSLGLNEEQISKLKNKWNNETK